MKRYFLGVFIFCFLNYSGVFGQDDPNNDYKISALRVTNSLIRLDGLRIIDSIVEECIDG